MSSTEIAEGVAQGCEHYSMDAAAEFVRSQAAEIERLKDQLAAAGKYIERLKTCRCGHAMNMHGDLAPDNLALGGPAACRHMICKCRAFWPKEQP